MSPRHQAELAAALHTAERLLRAATVEIEIVDPRSAAAQAALRQYFGELDARFQSGFDPDSADAADLDALGPPHGRFMLMRSDDTTVGCGGLQRIDDATSEIKRMWIDHSWRGLGLGRRLLASLEGVAADLGRSRVILDTNESLLEAITMYNRAGYEPIARYNDNPYAHHWFVKAI